MAKSSMIDEMEFLRPALEQGEIELKGQFMLGSNYTFLVNVLYAGQEIQAVYKPMRGEQLLWDFPEASLAGREVAAYLVSEALGFGFVPLTILRDGPFGHGSLQQFIDHNPNLHYFNLKPADRARLQPVALFDLLINNADRKGGSHPAPKADAQTLPDRSRAVFPRRRQIAHRDLGLRPGADTCQPGFCTD
jgi:uncharacterized repeat protein (TIGR03843 family)